MRSVRKHYLSQHCKIIRVVKIELSVTSAALFKVQLMVSLLQDVFGNAVFQHSKCVSYVLHLDCGPEDAAEYSMAVFAEFFVRKEMFVNGDF